MFLVTHTKSRMRRLISTYLDGELDPKRVRRLMAHLETCARCRAELAAGKQLVFTVTAALRKEGTPDILPGVLAALNVEKQRQLGRPGYLRLRRFQPVLTYSAAALFGIVAGILVYSSLGASATTASDPLPVQYLSEAPPNSLINLYYGDTVEVVNE